MDARFDVGLNFESMGDGDGFDLVLGFHFLPFFVGLFQVRVSVFIE